MTGIRTRWRMAKKEIALRAHPHGQRGLRRDNGGILTLLREVMMRDSEYRGIIRQFDLFFEQYAATTSPTVTDLYELLTAIEAKKEALYHFCQAIQEGLNNQLLKTEVFQDTGELPLGLKRIARHYMMATVTDCTAEAIEEQLSSVQTEMEHLTAEIQQFLAKCPTPEIRGTLIQQLETVYGLPEGPLRPPEERQHRINQLIAGAQNAS